MPPHIDAIYTTVRRYEPWFLGALAALVVAAILRRVHRTRVRKPAPHSAEGDGGSTTDDEAESDRP
ncbi:hypothetical protein [Actinomycetospora sp. TBRC 11914]|uniref:hypothetical protein n=1 Tax=Actinomycetospora sp. TBRC 11914 TaxID=2729387 RepID=UPI00145DCF47|nr:hypothetical protein [Actinomycetospora sp. TBRC 11914]NMO90240.1 hypothetical protein [Actinomycetospora sp. TBRC 11914]